MSKKEEYHQVADSWTTGKKHIKHHNSYYPKQTLTASLYDVWLIQNGNGEGELDESISNNE